MEKKTLIIMIGAIFTTIAYIVLSAMIQTTEAIWILTRIFGLLSFLGFFLVVLLGELRLTHKVKGEFTLFKFHKPLAIFSVFLVLLHLISALFDKYKWGVYLNFSQYLGFSFGDKWLIYLSLGTLAFYLFLIIGASSANKSMQILGFKKWKLIHFLSYVAFATSYIHAVNLGTDLKTSVFASILHPVVVLMFILVTGLLLLRMLNSFGVFEDQLEINITGVLIIVLILGSVFVMTAALESQERLDELNTKAGVLGAELNYHENTFNSLTNEVTQLNNQLAAVKNG
jgi:DMSO/TMAO reductase YedYZ heme-binding membrane subunit